MKFKQVIFSGIFWRGLYYATVLLLNIVVSRHFHAKGTGWIYYITNYFSLIILLASLSLESGMTYYGARNDVSKHKLASFSLLWSVAVTAIIGIVLLLFYHHPEGGYSVNQFILFAVTYTCGVMLTSFFSGLFYAQQNYIVPNCLLAFTNIVLALIILIPSRAAAEHSGHFLLRLYFLNFLLQGVLLAMAYLVKNRIFYRWSLPGISELKLLFRYSLLALFNNLLFFLLYRIDYWFVKNTCRNCIEGDLGNYIQVSKIGQLFFLLPVSLLQKLSKYFSTRFHKKWIQ